MLISPLTKALPVHIQRMPALTHIKKTQNNQREEKEEVGKKKKDKYRPLDYERDDSSSSDLSSDEDN